MLPHTAPMLCHVFVPNIHSGCLMQARHNHGKRLDTQFVIDFVRTHVPAEEGDSYPANVWRRAEELSDPGSWVLVMDYADASLQQV